MGRVTALRTRLTKYLHSPWFRRGVVSLALLAAVALWVEPQAIVAEVQRLSAGWVALALAISTLQIMLCAWRWQFTATLIDVPVRFIYALREYYLALLVNQLLPGGVLGDAGRAHRHATQAQSKGRAWRAVIIERSSGQVAVVLLTFTALMLSPLWYSALGGGVITAVGLSAAAALTLMIVSGFLLRKRLSVWLSQLPSWCQALARDIDRGLLRRNVWPKQLLSSLIIVLSYGLVMVCAARAIGVELPALEVLSLTPVLLLAMLIPFSVAGWGLREGAAAGVWALVGLPPAQGVAVSLAYGVLVLLASLPGIWVALSARYNAQASGGSIPQPHVEQSVVTTSKGARGRATRTIEGLDRRHFKTRPAGSDQQWGNQQVQAVNGIRFDKLRHGNPAAFDQHAVQTLVSQERNNITGRELAVSIQRQHAAFNVGMRPFKRYLRPHNMQRRGSIYPQQGQIVRSAATRVEYHSRGIGAADVANGELGVVGTGSACAHHNRVNKGTQPVQMNQTFMAVDVVRMTAFSRYTTIKALTQLRNYPGWLTRQRGHAVKQFTSFSRNGLGRLPFALGQQVNRHSASALMAHIQQPLPGISQRNNVDIGVGHDASVQKNPLHHAGRARLAQAPIVTPFSKPGGLHVPD